MICKGLTEKMQSLGSIRFLFNVAGIKGYHQKTEDKSNDPAPTCNLERKARPGNPDPAAGIVEQ